MLLRRLQLRNHRNYAHLDLEMGPGVNVFIGANGQGKTNLLEAVAMLALSASPRSRRESELIGPVAAASRIEAEVESAGRRVELTIALEQDGERAHRVIEIDEARRRAFELPGHFRVTLFWPDDLGLVKAGPELRRRFLNQILVQVEPGYARALAGLKRVLEQRNSLLKQIAVGEEACITRCQRTSAAAPPASGRTGTTSASCLTAGRREGMDRRASSGPRS